MKSKHYRLTPRAEVATMVVAVIAFVATVFIAPTYGGWNGEALLALIVLAMAVVFVPMGLIVIRIRMRQQASIARARKYPLIDGGDTLLILTKNIGGTFHQIERKERLELSGAENPRWEAHFEFDSDEEHMRFLMLRPPKGKPVSFPNHPRWGLVGPNTRIIPRTV